MFGIAVCERCGKRGQPFTLVGAFQVAMCQPCARDLDAMLYASSEYREWCADKDVTEINRAILEGGRGDCVIALGTMAGLRKSETDLRALALDWTRREFKFHPDGSQLKGPRELSAEELVDMRGKGKAKSKKTK